MVKIHCYGGSREVGGSAFLVKNSKKEVLLDCGIYLSKEVRIPPISNIRNLKGIVITHAHLDHSGGFPALYGSANPKLFATPLTMDISRVLIEGL